MLDFILLDNAFLFTPLSKSLLLSFFFKILSVFNLFSWDKLGTFFLLISLLSFNLVLAVFSLAISLFFLGLVLSVDIVCLISFFLGAFLLSSLAYSVKLFCLRSESWGIFLFLSRTEGFFLFSVDSVFNLIFVKFLDLAMFFNNLSLFFIFKILLFFLINFFYSFIFSV